MLFGNSTMLKQSRGAPCIITTLIVLLSFSTLSVGAPAQTVNKDAGGNVPEITEADLKAQAPSNAQTLPKSEPGKDSQALLKKLVQDKYGTIPKIDALDNVYRTALLNERKATESTLERTFRGFTMPYYLEDLEATEYEKLTGQLKNPKYSRDLKWLEDNVQALEKTMDYQNARMVRRVQGIQERFGKYDPKTKTFAKEGKIKRELQKLNEAPDTAKNKARRLQLIKDQGGMGAAKEYMEEANEHNQVLDRMYKARIDAKRIRISNPEAPSAWKKLLNWLKVKIGVKVPVKDEKERIRNEVADRFDSRKSGINFEPHFTQQAVLMNGPKTAEKEQLNHMRLIGLGYSKLPEDEASKVLSNAGAAADQAAGQEAERATTEQTSTRFVTRSENVLSDLWQWGTMRYGG